jgi:hypothetical protein
MRLFERAAAPSTAAGLQEFNHLVLQYQEEAYSAACYLAGSESRAAGLVSAAVTHLFARWRSSAADFRLELLGQLVQEYAGLPNSLPDGNLFSDRLDGLAREEKAALVLLECLQLTYAQAARVLRRPVPGFARLLAQARSKMVRDVIRDA